MKLLLTSAGMNVKDELIKILPKPASQLKLAHIITATKTESDTGYALRDKQRMIELGFDVEDIDLEGKNESNLKQLLQNKDVVSVQGGNTFYLLKHVKLSGFDRVVKDFINQEKIYIGVSAGSFIACPTIEQTAWKMKSTGNFGVTNLVALNLVPFLIFAHFKEEVRSFVEKGVQTTRYPVVALSDTQAVLVEDGKWKIVGEGKREFFNGFHETLA
jgi:dipeptidase E